MEWGTVVTAVIASVFGGGGVGGVMTIYYRYYIVRQTQSHSQSKDHQIFINEQNKEVILGLQAELKSVRNRLLKMEQAYDDIREELAKEYAKDIQLQAEANRLKDDNGRLHDEIKALRESVSKLRGEHG